MSAPSAARVRRSFAKLERILEAPNLIDIQRSSFAWFLETGLRRTIDDISPITDYTGSLAVEFGEYEFGDPPKSIRECRETDANYSRPLHMTVRFINRDTGEIREQRVFMGDIPIMTDQGTFIINGTERIVVTQLVRSPGAYIMGPKDAEKQVFTANLMPSRGSWLELEIDKKGLVNVRIDRKRKLPISTVLRALPHPEDPTDFAHTTDRELSELFADSAGRPNWYVDATIEKESVAMRAADALDGAQTAFSRAVEDGDVPATIAPDLVTALIRLSGLDTEAAEAVRATTGELSGVELAAAALLEILHRAGARQNEPLAFEDLAEAPELSELDDDARTAVVAAVDEAQKHYLDNRKHLGEAALIEVFKKQRPGEPPTVDNSRKLTEGLFFDPKRYDLTSVGRYKLNTRLYGDPAALPEDQRALVITDIQQLVRHLVELPGKLDPNGDVLSPETKDFADAAASLPRDGIQGELDEYEHFGNRRLRTVGELIQDSFRVGLYRMERVVRERMTTEDPDTITPQTIINIRPVVASLKEFFGSSQLSQFMDQTNSLSGLTHRRRLSALGAGGLTRERAPIEVRDVHTTHYGRMCPIETPEGPNIGLIGNLASYAKVSRFGFIQTPYRTVRDGLVTKEIRWLDASEERDTVIAQASAVIGPDDRLAEDQVLVRRGDGSYDAVPPADVDLMDVDPQQLVSVATALIPFLEHNDANRALMGANMQKQAVPLLLTEAPLVGTGMERRAAIDTGDVIINRRAGTVSKLDATEITVTTPDGEHDVYELFKFRRSNQGTIIHQRPIVSLGQTVVEGDVLCDGSSTDQGELALGKNLLVAFMTWEGYNFEDAIILSERLVKDDVLSSIHIEEYEVDARSTKLGDEEITRDIPNRAEQSLANLDERGIVRIGAEVESGDLLVGKVTPKGETELTAEEKLIRAIFKEKAREVRDTSLKVPHGEGGKVIDVKTFSRENNDEQLNPGVNELVRVYVAKKRKISEGDKLAGRHGNKGVIAKIVPEEDMPFLADGSPVDIILNPLGVPSRMNIGQVLETHLGWAAANGFDADVMAGDGDPTNGGPPAPIYKARKRVDRPTTQYVSTPVFNGATEVDVDEALVSWERNHDPSSAVHMKVNEGRAAGNACSGKVQLYNGRTGEPYDQKVTVGYMYILKLLHLVDDKIHARSTGPYSLVTQQPLGGKAQFGGQRFGEMEVWALEAYGAAHTLQEMLTIKSDDTIGRVKAYEAIVKGESIAEPSIPESFKVLLKEMRSLALDVSVRSEEGAHLEVHEEDDDLLRAAEELGIDLSQIRQQTLIPNALSEAEVAQSQATLDPPAADEDSVFGVPSDERTDAVATESELELEEGTPESASGQLAEYLDE